MDVEFEDKDIGIRESTRGLKFICEREDAHIIIRKVRSVIARDLLSVLLLKMSKEWNQWTIGKKERKWLMGELGINCPSQLSRAFDDLRDIDFIRGKKSIMVNPVYYWKQHSGCRPQMIAVYNKYDENIDYSTGELKKK